MAMPGIVIEIGADTKDAISGINRVRGELGDSLGNFDRFRSGVNAAFVPAMAVMAGAAAAGIAFAKAAAEDAQQAEILATALRNNAGATDANIQATEDWIAAQGKQLGFADDQLRPSLAALVRATGDVAEAQSLAATAMDVATATGRPLEAVSLSLAKAHAGSTAALGKLVPGIDKAVLASGDMTKIQGELARLMGGSAAASANTAAGQMKRFQLSLSETKEAIGAALLPILEKLQPYLAAMAQWAQEHTPLIIGVAGAITGLAAVIVTLKVAMDAMRIVQMALNVAMAANPAVLIALAIAALVAVVYVAYQRFDGFRALVDAVWQGIQAAAAAVVDWYQTYLAPVVEVVVGLIVGYFRTMLTIYVAIWQGIMAAAGVVVDWYQTYVAPVVNVVVGLIVGYFQTMLAAYQLIWQGIQAAASLVVDWYQTYLAPIISFVAGLIVGYFQTMLAAYRLVWDAIKAAAAVVVGWFTETLVPAFRKVWGLLTAGWQAVGDFVRGLFDSVVQFFTDQVDKWTEIGRNIVEGIKKGISGAWDAFTGWLKDKVGSIVDGVKGVFGIQSPSRVFADIGRQIVAGWRIGLGGIDGVNASVLSRANGLVASLPTVSASPAQVPGGIGQPAAGSGFGGVAISEEQIVRALGQLLLSSDLRNGRTVVIA